MATDEERRRENKQLDLIDDAFRKGDLEALRAAVGDPSIVPNGQMPLSIGPCLTYAIYWSPFAFIKQLLDLGADPNVKTRIDDYETPGEMARKAGLASRLP